MKKTTSTVKIVLLGLCLAGTGCATHPPQPEPGAVLSEAELTRAALADSSIDISYVLGHSHRRFVAWAKKESFGGQTLVDHQVLRESGIERAHYSEFFGKAEQFVSAPRRHLADQPAASEEACRTPFTVTVRVGTDTKTLQGCRGADEGALSHLVRDGEFLLYSNK
jgi:hypothetical protein